MKPQQDLDLVELERLEKRAEMVAKHHPRAGMVLSASTVLSLLDRIKKAEGERDEAVRQLLNIRLNRPSHDDLCRLSVMFGRASDLRTEQDVRINGWLGGQIADATAPIDAADMIAEEREAWKQTAKTNEACALMWQRKLQASEARAHALEGALEQSAMELDEAANIVAATYPNAGTIFRKAAERARAPLSPEPRQEDNTDEGGAT